jgi:hypothetical protein
MRNYAKLCYMGAVRLVRFFEDTDAVDTKNAFDAMDREWRQLWPSETPVPERRFLGRPVACITEKRTGEVKKSGPPVIPMVSVLRRPPHRSAFEEVPEVGEHVEETPYLPGPVWVPRAGE